MNRSKSAMKAGFVFLQSAAVMAHNPYDDKVYSAMRWPDGNPPIIDGDFREWEWEGMKEYTVPFSALWFWGGRADRGF